MNRKLIRPSLAGIQSKDHPEENGGLIVPRAFDGHNSQEERFERRNQQIGPAAKSRSAATVKKQVPSSAPAVAAKTPTANAEAAVAAPKNRRVPPPQETSAEVYYYKKQIDAHTPMIIVLQDNEQIEGTIEWYDRHALKVNRKRAPNIMLLKHNIKYMFKAEDSADIE